MSKYVMSDLHGRHDKFLEMLKLINFTDEDEMYINGDIFDRGEKPLDILDYVLSHKNIHLIKGNHEQMFEDYYDDYSNINLWYLNGGNTTHYQLIERGISNVEAVYKYICKLPIYKIVDNNIIVHAGIFLPHNYGKYTVEEIMEMQDKELMLWGRGAIGYEQKIEGYNIICGHTPVMTIEEGCNSIIERNGTYYIDCGCVFEKHGGRLACLRLDDKEEFYV